MELEIKDQKAALELMGKEREALKLRVMRLEKRQLSLQEDVETGYDLSIVKAIEPSRSCVVGFERPAPFLTTPLAPSIAGVG